VGRCKRQTGRARSPSQSGKLVLKIGINFFVYNKSLKFKKFKLKTLLTQFAFDRSVSLVAWQAFAGHCSDGIGVEDVADGIDSARCCGIARIDAFLVDASSL
jgi:hypothetical protein